MPRQLKVFCTPIGFHDAYVAAPSQKAALEAWGADTNLFARGMAAAVTDPKLMKAPLATPGQVIKLARGTAEQHLAALPKASKARSALPTGDKKAKPATPKPSRRGLDAAEQALERAEARYRKSAEAIREREDALRRERHAFTTKRDAEMAKLQRQLDDRRDDYDRAMDAWRGG